MTEANVQKVRRYEDDRDIHSCEKNDLEQKYQYPLTSVSRTRTEDKPFQK